MKVRGGDKWKKRLAQLIKKTHVRAGVLEGATNGDGESVAEYAAYNEYGTPEIPRRPFMRRTIAEHKQEWGNTVTILLKKGYSIKEALDTAGRRMADDIQATIKSDMPPPNSKKWAEAKNKHEMKRSGVTRAGTLIDTGALVESINWQFGDD